MSKRPFFSIIIPALNEERQLPALLTSILAQEFSDFEVIVSDAVGEDNTASKARSFISKFEKKNISCCVLSKHERSVSKTRNHGASKAHGVYLIFFDADNTIPPDYLLKVHAFIKARRSPPFLTTAIDVDRRNVYGHVVRGYINTIGKYGKYVEQPFAPGYNTILKRTVFEKVGGYDPNVTVFEDYELSIRMHKLGYTLTFIPDTRIVFSMRRFRKEPIKQFATYGRIILHCVVYGPPRNTIFNYPMGGHAHPRG